MHWLCENPHTLTPLTNSLIFGTSPKFCISSLDILLVICSMLQFLEEGSISLMGKEVSVGQVLSRLIQHKDSHNNALIQKFTLDYLVGLLDRSKICEIQKVYSNSPEGLTIFDFTRFFLNTLEHREQETLYLTITIIDLFKDVAFFNDVAERIQFQHLTNYICKGILSERDGEYQIKARHLPNERKLNPSESIREVEVFAPIVYGKTNNNPIKFSKAKIKADRTKHTGIITCAFYSHSKRNIFCLDSLSQSIGRYDVNAQLVGKVTPTTSKIKRDAIILSFAYSERQERIGALLKNYEIIFWDIEDNFSVEKCFSTTKSSAEQQTSIWFLEYHNHWVTADAVGGFSIWDLQTEEIVQHVRLRSKVTEVCEIRCLNLIAIAHEKLPDGRKDESESKISLYNMVKNSIVVELGMGFQSFKHRAINTLQFSNTYQILLYGDSSKEITLLEINPQFFDATVKGKLTGHENTVTNFVLIKKTPTVVSCDDKQKIKVWDIRNCSCVQTLDFEGKTVVTRLVSMVRIDKFAIAGGRLYMVDIEKREEGRFEKTLLRRQVQPVGAYFEPTSKELLVFTKSDLRFYNLETGKVNRIFTGYIEADEEITSLKYLNNCRMFILGNHQGLMRIYSKMSGSLCKTLQPHEREVTAINYDSLNHLYVSSSFDSNIIIQKERDTRGKFQTIRSIKDNFFKREINLCELSAYHNFIAVGGFQEKSVYIWDYEYCKLLGEISLRNKAEPTAFCFINGYSMLVIGDNQNNVSVVELIRPDSYSFRMELVAVLELEECPTHFLLDTSFERESSKGDYKLVVAVKKGVVYEINLASLFTGRNIQKHISTRLNYNPERQVNESFISEYGKKLFKILDIQSHSPISCIQPSHTLKFKAHQEDITCLLLVNLKHKNYCTCSLDKRIKIWSSGGSLLCDVNVNLSLPYKWGLEMSNEELLKGKIMFALKILEIIIIRNKSNISLSEWGMLKVNNFFKTLLNTEGLPKEEEEECRRGQLRMFGEEFGKDEVDFERSKKFCFKEVSGPRLKQLEAKKRTNSIQKSLKSALQRAEEEKLKVMEQLRVRKTKHDQKEQLMQMFRSPNEEKAPHVTEAKQLFHKLERLLNKSPPEEQSKENPLKHSHKTINHEIRINRNRSHNKSSKHISFEEYFEKSRTFVPALKDSKYGFNTSHSEAKLDRSNKHVRKQGEMGGRQGRSAKFVQVLNEVNGRVRWKRLLHTRGHERTRG